MASDNTRITPPRLSTDQVRELTALEADIAELKAYASKFEGAGFDVSSVHEQLDLAERQRRFLLDEFGGRPARRR